MSEEERLRADVEPTMPGEPLGQIVAAARRRLGRIEVRRAVVRHAALVCVAAALCAASRPFVWALHDGVVWKAALRSGVLAAAGASVVIAALVVRAWRGRPSLLGSARRLDGALGLAEVIASGFAFERDGRADEMATYATHRARRALTGVDVAQALVPQPFVRSKRGRQWLAGAAVAAVLGIAVGGIDRLVVERAIHPVTSREAAAAAELKKAAEQAATNVPRGPNDPKDPKAEEILEAAKRASEAAQRGDRRRAQEALEDMRKASRALEADEREQARSLRALRDELEGASASAKGAGDAEGKERPGRPSATASEALAKLKKELESSSGDKEAVRKMIERLERAESAARSAGEKSGGKQASGKKASPGSGGDEREAAWSRAAAALKEAREAAARGDAEGAKRAMERAERELSAMEKAGSSSSAGAMSRLADGASELDRSMHAAMTGARSSGKPGDDGREGAPGGSGDKSGAGASRSASNDKGDPSGTPGSGPGAGDRTPGPSQRRVKVSGDLQARADVREGERAVSALEGMGRGGDPKAYREIFPSYDTVVEDGLREDTVPAARRPIVRRYFSSIRPGGDQEESRK